MKIGFVAIIGRPSAGKSTLLNALCGQKVAICSPVPQTTRNTIRGVVNRKAGQLVFLDSPGYQGSMKKMNLYLKDLVHRSLDDADAALYVVDITRPPRQEEEAVMRLLASAGKPMVVALNKIDLSTGPLEDLRSLITKRLSPAVMVEVSATEARGLEQLMDALLDICPEGEPLYGEEFYTDQDPEFRIAEIIREQAILRTEREVPHALYIEIADMEFTHEEGRKPSLWVRAFLVVEQPSQVGILVGHQGKRIKEIRIASLKEAKRVFSWALRLDLRVKVNPKWRRKDALLRRMIKS